MDKIDTARRAGTTEHVAALERGLEVIRCLCAEPRRATLAEIARDTNLSRASARRFLLSLNMLGYVECDGRYFQLTRHILDLGHAYLSSLPWWRAAEREVGRLATRLELDAFASVLDRGRVATVASSTHERFSIFEREAGLGEPAYSSAPGRVLLAHLSTAELAAYLEEAPLRQLTPFTVSEDDHLRRSLIRIREEGHAVAAQEMQIGVTGVAVPIRDRDDRVVAALSVQYASSRDIKLTELVDTLIRASDSITADADHE